VGWGGVCSVGVGWGTASGTLGCHQNFANFPALEFLVGGFLVGVAASSAPGWCPPTHPPPSQPPTPNPQPNPNPNPQKLGRIRSRGWGSGVVRSLQDLVVPDCNNRTRSVDGSGRPFRANRTRTSAAIGGRRGQAHPRRTRSRPIAAIHETAAPIVDRSRSDHAIGDAKGSGGIAEEILRCPPQRPGHQEFGSSVGGLGLSGCGRLQRGLGVCDRSPMQLQLLAARPQPRPLTGVAELNASLEVLGAPSWGSFRAVCGIHGLRSQLAHTLALRPKAPGLANPSREHRPPQTGTSHVRGGHSWVRVRGGCVRVAAFGFVGRACSLQQIWCLARRSLKGQKAGPTGAERFSDRCSDVGRFSTSTDSSG
jgi:hypothetical protein